MGVLFGGDFDLLCGVFVQLLFGGCVVECVQEVLVGDGFEFGEYLFGRVEFDWKGVQLWFLWVGGFIMEVWCYVFDYQC